LNYKSHRLITFSAYLIIAGLLYLVPVFMHHNMDAFRLIRPLQEIPRDVWVERYLIIFLLSIALVYLISTLFLFLETYVYLTAKSSRMLIHGIILIILIVGANILVSRAIPFAPGLGMKVFGTLSGVLAVQSFSYLFIFPPSHYRGLLRR
jgi:uncharacterized membrane protein